ncbi:short-chain dehydrogenase/reductase SDR [Coprinopsis marcescibilis]|uniref:Short-chain dehydrogenase/reductase SDR n=1 Tax=Coprinopsis marcescibilis TaxID=230819 RepID=A0A5C3KJN4_COPMA|nr:short-chain dehydrogenase/reductase SDR [Coprinopsis marcescibilis]
MAQVLNGKVAIITGASSGIGLATARTFLEAGASVLGVDRSAAPESLSSNEQFKFHQADLSDATAATSILDAAKAAFNRVDILVNNAGIMDFNAGVATLDDETWDKVIAINLTAPVKLMREAVKIMKEQGGGTIVNVASKAGTSGASAGVAYTCSKHGLVGATKNTAWLYKDDGIRCNAICPGAVATNIMANTDYSKLDMQSLMRLKPVLETHTPKLGQPEGVAVPDTCAKAILFLASDLSTGITGVALPVDNGWSTI